MTPHVRHFLIAGLLALVAGLPVAAQTTPSTEQMIQQLKPARTRSLRNLTVEADVPPSLTLQIQFELNSAVIDADSGQALHSLAQALQSADLSGSRFAVEGHTDAKGNAQLNLRLSQQRARSVADFLIAQGVAGARLDVVGKGSAEPLDPNAPYAPENRRVRITRLD